MKLKNSKVIILDSWPVIGWLRGEKPAVTAMEKLLKKAEASQVKVFFNLINWGEVIYQILREFGEKTLIEVIVRFERLPIQLEPVDEELVIAAARWKTGGGLSYADCFAVATAQKLGGVILTGDPEFKSVEKKIPIIWIGG
ncbi:type II toxin-antitoxin system VapC family toxin [Candidatus Collierbacteria bacterium]|nr:type II toxin-antitoxin system VapC family toxin [Candidatus Collierbacteria bacterium]